MPNATGTVVIGRPVDVVVAYVLDGENGPTWRSGVIDISRVSGAGVGTIYKQGVRGPMGRRIAADYAITVLEPNRAIEFQTTTGPVRPQGRFDVEAVDGGTRLTFTLDAELTGIKKLLMSGMVQKSIDAETQALQRLKQVIEA